MAVAFPDCRLNIEAFTYVEFCERFGISQVEICSSATRLLYSDKDCDVLMS